MTTRRVRAGGVTIERRTPPTEIQLWDVGDNPTDYGMHRWTERSVREVFARYEARGNPLIIDVEHLGATGQDHKEPPERTGAEPQPMGGYARLELRDGAPWLTFEWSSYAEEQISSGQRRFLSPEYDVDRTTGEITALFRVSLVADPGTHRARVLAAAPKGQSSMELGMILAALRAALAAEDPAVTKESIANLVAELGKSEVPADGGTTTEAGAGDGTDGSGTSPNAGTEQTSADGEGSNGAPGGDDAEQQAARAAATARARAAAPPPAPAPRAPAAALAAAAPPETASVQAAAAQAVVQIENAQRDHLIQTEGSRLEASIRRWASTQPLKVVRGLLDAMPAEGTPSRRVAATRGETQGRDQGEGLEGADLEELRSKMGIVKASAATAPYTNDRRELVLPLVRPSVVKAAATAGKAGK